LEHFLAPIFKFWKIALRPTTFPRIAPAALREKPLRLTGCPSPVQFSFDGLDKKRIFHHHMAVVREHSPLKSASQFIQSKYYPVKRAVFFCQAHHHTIASFPLLV